MKHYSIDDPQFNNLWNEIDQDGSGYLDKKEFE